ncbi:MAG: hypothetical protein WAV98_01710 [Minisyncoccia bacterium]
MKKGNIVGILGGLSVIVGFSLLLYNPDYAPIHITELEVLVIRTAGVFLVIAGMLIPAIYHSNKNQRQKQRKEGRWNIKLPVLF